MLKDGALSPCPTWKTRPGPAVFQSKHELLAAMMGVRLHASRAACAETHDGKAVPEAGGQLTRSRVRPSV